MELTYLVIAILICVGLYAIVAKRNLLKIVIGINILESAVIFLFVFSSYRPGGTVPIISGNHELFVDPVPQALALTAIVIGASTTALMLGLIIELYKRYDTLNITKIRKMRG